jgi:hypothetical protein
MLLAVVVAAESKWPPTLRAHTPPPWSSGRGLGGLPMKALDCVRNAVFAELIEETRAAIDADPPATAAVHVPTSGDIEARPVEVH